MKPSSDRGAQVGLTPWIRDRLCPDTLWPGQESCHKAAIIEAIDCAQHTDAPTWGLRRLESFEVAISVTADAIDHMMGVGQ